jgi:hypothetical protein
MNTEGEKQHYEAISKDADKKIHNSVAFKWRMDGIKSSVYRKYYVSISDTTAKFRFSVLLLLTNMT